MFCFDGHLSPLGSDADRRYEKSRVENTKSPEKPKASTKSFPELKVVEIHSKPGPDGEERLRRLFTLLVKLASDDEALPLRK